MGGGMGFLDQEYRFSGEELCLCFGLLRRYSVEDLLYLEG